MTNSELISLIKHRIASRLTVLNEQATEYDKLHPASIKYTDVDARIKELEELNDLIKENEE